MATFSNTPYESELLSNLYDILTKLPNNTANLIKPRDLRDGVYTIWENILFKNTTVNGSTVSYFGLDNPDYKSLFYLGKKELSGNPIMSDLLLNSDSDYYIFNNKSDSNPSLQDTKISFLAGPSSSDYYYAPYINAKKITTPARIDLQIINPATGGAIDIGSTQNNVSLSGVVYPKGASASLGNTLIYTAPNELSWTSSAIILGTVSYIPYIGPSNTLLSSNLKHVGDSTQIINDRYLSDESGLYRFNFNNGTFIEMSTDGGLLINPHFKLDTNKLELISSNGSLLLNNTNIILNHTNINLVSTHSYLSSSTIDIKANSLTLTGSTYLTLYSDNIDNNATSIYGINSNDLLTINSINSINTSIDRYESQTRYLNNTTTLFTHSVGTYGFIAMSQSSLNFKHSGTMSMSASNISMSASNIRLQPTTLFSVASPTISLVSQGETKIILGNNNTLVSAANLLTLNCDNGDIMSYAIGNNTLQTDIGDVNLISANDVIVTGTSFKFNTRDVVTTTGTQVLTNKTLISTNNTVIDATRLQTFTISTTTPTRTSTSDVETTTSLIWDGSKWEPTKITHYEVVNGQTGTGTFNYGVTHSMNGAYVDFTIWQYDSNASYTQKYTATASATKTSAPFTNDSVLYLTLDQGDYIYHVVINKGYGSTLYAP